MLFALALLTLGCNDNIGTDPAAGKRPEVRFIHAAPMGSRVDLFFDTIPIASDREFGSIQNEYRGVDAGQHLINLVSTGGNASLTSHSFTFHPGDRYTIFAVSDTLGAMSLLFYRDNLAPPPAGKANVRIANLIPDAPAVRLAFSGSGQGPIFNNVKFMDNTEIFKPVDAQQVTLRVIDAAFANGGSGGGNGSGTGGGGKNKHAILKDQPASLANGQLYTFALMGRLVDSSATIMVIEQEPDTLLTPNSGD